MASAFGIIGTAYVHLGDAPYPEGHADRNLVLARQDIELLGLLQEKTKGNLSPEEQSMMDTALYEAQMRFIRVASEYAELP